jgi:Rrf2 family transcriptional regulator, iron-sulfur cluster assembly transcription factor
MIIPEVHDSIKGGKMKLTTQIRYGVRALCDIAYNSEGAPIQVSSISLRQSISPRYIEQIFQKLKNNGIVKSVRGPSGGYTLARRPEKITIGDVIRAVDGDDIRLVLCSGSRRGSKDGCKRFGKCVVSDIWSEASKRLMDYFDSVTLDTVCNEAREKGFGLEVPPPGKGAEWTSFCPYAA